MSLTELKQQISQLSFAERLELQEFLVSIEQTEPLSPAWQIEIERRLKDVRFGQMQSLTHQDFWQRIRSSRA